MGVGDTVFVGTLAVGFNTVDDAVVVVVVVAVFLTEDSPCEAVDDGAGE